MKILLPSVLLFFFNGLLAPQAEAQGDFSGVEKFAKDITGVIWNLRGTSSLKHLRYSGESVEYLNSHGQVRGFYDSSFIDVGVIRLNFKGVNTGWYFFSDDLKWVTPSRVSGEEAFKLAASSASKAVSEFPEDIKGIVWESVPDERNLAALKIRWNGKDLEFGMKQGKEWEIERLSPVVANRRVFELVFADASVVWFAFSANGKEAWMLQISGIYGGQSQSVVSQASLTAKQSGLRPHHADLGNHAVDLRSAGEKMRAETLRRHLLRSLSRFPKLAEALERRLSNPK